MQSISLSSDICFPASTPFEVVVGYNASKFSEQAWKDLLKEDVEGYRLHLAFDSANVEGFKTGYIGIKKHNVLLCLAPYFVTDYALDSTVQGKLKHFLTKVREKLPNLMNVKIICVGSPVTDSCKLAINQEYPFDPEIIRTLNKTLFQIAEKEKASVIAFKDILERDVQLYGNTLGSLGYGTIKNMPVATNLVPYKSLDEYLATLSYATRKDIRRKLKKSQDITIKEYQGTPPDLDKIYDLYLETYERSELKFEKLTPTFFEYAAGLMPEQCRFVLYYLDDELIAFNMLLHNEEILLDKYIGMKQPAAKKYDIYFLSWIHNIEMAIRDGFNTYQSGQAAYETKKRLGAELEDTYLVFTHKNPIMNQPLKWLSKLLAYGNFDHNV